MNMLRRMTPEQVQAHNANIERGGRVVRGRSAMDDHGQSGRKPKPPELLKEKRRARELSRIPEWRVLKGCADLLEAHPRVAFYWRQNTGSFLVGGRFIKFSFRGASDLMAVMKGTAQFWAIECKSTGKKATQDQQAFLDAVVAVGGQGICVDDPKKLADALNARCECHGVPVEHCPEVK